jgi:hypothetical protein
MDLNHDLQNQILLCCCYTSRRCHDYRLEFEKVK